MRDLIEQNETDASVWFQTSVYKWIRRNGTIKNEMLRSVLQTIVVIVLAWTITLIYTCSVQCIHSEILRMVLTFFFCCWVNWNGLFVDVQFDLKYWKIIIVSKATSSCRYHANVCHCVLRYNVCHWILV